MRAALNHAPLAHYDDLICPFYGGDAVGYENGGALFHQFAKTPENPLLGIGIDAGKGVVQDQNFRPAQNGARQGGALLLAAREGDAALANHGIESLRKALNLA